MPRNSKLKTAVVITHASSIAIMTCAIIASAVRKDTSLRCRRVIRTIAWGVQEWALSVTGAISCSTISHFGGMRDVRSAIKIFAARVCHGPKKLEARQNLITQVFVSYKGFTFAENKKPI